MITYNCETLPTVREFSPTGFDWSIGDFGAMADQKDWIVCPCTRNRDSDALTESNFHSLVEILGGESDTVKVCRFGHWGNGWFEVIIVDPNSAETVAKLESVISALENYPVLDDEDLSERENELFIEYVTNSLSSEIDSYLDHYYDLDHCVCMDDTDRDTLLSLVSDDVRDYWSEDCWPTDTDIQEAIHENLVVKIVLKRFNQSQTVIAKSTLSDFVSTVESYLKTRIPFSETWKDSEDSYQWTESAGEYSISIELKA